MLSHRTLQASSSGNGYPIARSLRFRATNGSFLSRTLVTPTDNKKWTWSGWVKRSTLSASQVLFGAGANSNTIFAGIYFAGDAIDFFNYDGGITWRRTTTALYRDPSAWMHIVCIFDSNNVTANDQVQVWVNGVRVTSFSAITNPAGVSSLLNNSSQPHTLGLVRTVTYNTYFDGYMAEVNFIDGQALDSSFFGKIDPSTSVWAPKKYTGTYGINGFYLDFSDPTTTSTICTDRSGNGNNWTPNSISVTAGTTYDSMLDVPTLYPDGGNGRGNYCTLNPISTSVSSYVKEANLSLSGNATAEYPGVGGTIYVSSGKWYWEHTAVAGGTLNCTFGCATATAFGGTFQTGAGSVGYTNDTGAITVGGSTITTGAAFGGGDIIGVALDMNAGTLQFYKNNSATGAQITGLTGAYTPAMNLNYYPSNTIYLNCGQRPFTYTPPSGFLPLHTGNFPQPTIKKPTQYFDASTYAGTSAIQTITNAGSFQPDLVWIKGRSAAFNHILQDSVRGVGLTGKKLSSNLTDSEGSTNFDTSYGYVDTLNATGFSLNKNGTGGNDWASTNVTGQTYVAWQWKKGVIPGFDIVLYTGTSAAQTVPHSLGAIPKLIITKTRNAVLQWPVYHASLGISQYLELNTTIAAGSIANYWGSTSPTTSVFSLPNTAYNNNINGNTYVAYLFAEVSGFSKIGSYSGNGAADGAFVYCGFRPKFLMIKRTDSAVYWLMYDTTRNTYNNTNLGLQPHVPDIEVTASSLDLLSNGFKWRDTNAGYNASGGTYIFIAFAEAPFKYALAR